VYYWPEDPNVAVIAPPSEILTEQLPSWLAGSFLVSVVVVAAVLTLRGSGLLSQCFPGAAAGGQERHYNSTGT
jgi:hypothetical protein